MKKVILVLVISLFLTNCNQDKLQFKYSKKVKFNYKQDAEFSNKDFLVIDKHVFRHSKYADSLYKYIPSDTLILKKYDREFKERNNTLFIAINLANKLKQTDEYIIHNSAMLLTKGVIVLSRRDGKELKIGFAKNYPINIEYAK